MRAVIQRVRSASVSIEGQMVSEIGRGLCVFIGVGHDDAERDAEWIAEKTANLRVFEDAEGKMNLSLLDIGGEVLVVSQFTLYADARKGRRPSFTNAAPPEKADALYLHFADLLRRSGIHTQTGEFGARMLVNIENDGPVTILLDTSVVSR